MDSFRPSQMRGGTRLVRASPSNIDGLTYDRCVRISLIACLCVALVPAFIALGKAVHPQDGPHADLRLTIDESGVGFQVGINLAFIDEAVSVPREALDQLAPVEVQAIEDALRRFMAEDVVVKVDGRVIKPEIDQYHFFDEPEPWMIGAFPSYGARALIRAAIHATYDTPNPRVVEVTWPTYPRDRVAAELEGMTGQDGGAPFMVLECLVQSSDGTVKIMPFSKPKPTIEWHADEAGDSRYEAVPPVPQPSEPLRLSMLGLVLLAMGVPASFIIWKRSPGASAHFLGVATLVGAFVASAAAALLLPTARVAVPGTGGELDLPSAERVSAIFQPLHANLYRAFDHGSEEEIYDALERSVDGPLLKDLYMQVYNSLVDAEQGGMLGIVTGVKPEELAVQTISVDQDGRANIDVLHRWQVEGSVYHWGHSHTRIHEYEAIYTLAGLDQGWRIIDQQMRQQRRVDEDGQRPEQVRQTF